MVLNQRQVFVIVSDWEPDLGSLFCVGFCGWLFPVSVFSAPDRTVSGFAMFFCFCNCVHIEFLILKNHEL